MFFTKTQHTRMNSYPHLVFVYFNGAKPLLQFMVSEDTPLVDLKFKLNTLLQYLKNQRVVKLEYHSPWIDDEGKIWFTKLEVKTNEDLNVTCSIFYRYSSKGPIEVDVTIARSTRDILKMLQRAEPHVCNEIKY